MSDKKTNLTRWQQFLWRLGFTGYAHITNASESLEQRQLATVRSTLAVVRKERDRAFLLLHAIGLAGGIPSQLNPSINGLIARESEGDIEDARNEALEFLASKGMGRPRD